MKEIILGIVSIIVAIVVLRFAGRLLVRFVFEPLERLCIRHGYSTSPIPLGIWTAFFLYEYNSHGFFYRLFTQWRLTRWLPTSIIPWIILGLMAIPYIVLLVKTRVIYFIPVIITKILIYPMALVAILCGYEAEEKVPIEGDLHIPGGNRQYSPPSGSGSSSQYAYNKSSGGSYQYAATQSSGSNSQADYLGDKYRDQYRASQAGDAYSSVEVGGERVFFNGDYVPFGAEGEIRTYDSDYSPMD